MAASGTAAWLAASAELPFAALFMEGRGQIHHTPQRAGGLYHPSSRFNMALLERFHHSPDACRFRGALPRGPHGTGPAKRDQGFADAGIGGSSFINVMVTRRLAAI